MYGWINECVRGFVLEKFGQATWDAIVAKHSEGESDFLRYEYYSDSTTMELVAVISEMLNISIPEVLETFGEYFIKYMSREYSNLLQCLGSTLVEWLSNVNMLHVHLNETLPKMVSPYFRCARFEFLKLISCCND
jgi:guanylate cyclase soluble subunit beta